MFTPSTKFLIKKNNIQKQGVCCTRRIVIVNFQEKIKIKNKNRNV